jgi:type IX secretion system PorP/SprF family membrane protein
MKKILIILFTLISTLAIAQDMQFSHINETKLYLNPAYAGKQDLPNAIFGHRNFAPSGFGDYLSYHASYHQKIDLLKGGVGINFINDRQGNGVINRTYASAMYAYHFEIDNNIKIQAGLESRFALLSINTQNLVFPNMFDPISWQVKDETEYTRENLTSLTGNYIDFNAGVLMTYQNYMLRKYREFNIGFSVHHLNTPGSFLNFGNEKIERRYNLYFDIVIPLMDRRSVTVIPLLTPVFLAQKQGADMSFHYGGYLTYGNLDFGFLMRHNQLFQYINSILFVGLSYGNTNLSYSYDAAFLTKMKKNPISGAHEVTLSINFQYKRDE